jgi:hypothetical protein
VVSIPLYERVDALQTVEAWLLENDGELTPELEQLMAEAVGDFEAKVESVAGKVRELTVTADAVQAEAHRLAARATAFANAAARLKDYLHRELTRADRPSVKGTRFTVAIQRNTRPAIAAIVPLDTLPADWCRVSVKMALDTDRVMEAWKAGSPLPDGISVTVGTHVRIR